MLEGPLVNFLLFKENGSHKTFINRSREDNTLDEIYKDITGVAVDFYPSTDWEIIVRGRLEQQGVIFISKENVEAYLADPSNIDMLRTPPKDWSSYFKKL